MRDKSHRSVAVGLGWWVWACAPLSYKSRNYLDKSRSQLVLQLLSMCPSVEWHFYIVPSFLFPFSLSNC